MRSMKVFLTEDDFLIFIDAEGAIVREKALDVHVTSGIILDNQNRIYAGTDSLGLCRFSSAGDLEWSCPVEAPIESTPALLDNGLLIVACMDGMVYGIQTDAKAPVNSPAPRSSGDLQNNRSVFKEGAPR